MSIVHALVVLDLETTGLDRIHDHITQLAAAVTFWKYDPHTGHANVISDQLSGTAGLSETFSTLVYTSKPIPMKIQQLTHITPAMLSGAPTIKVVLEEFHKWIWTWWSVAQLNWSSTRYVRWTLVGHNVIGFDIKMLDTILAKLNGVPIGLSLKGSESFLGAPYSDSTTPLPSIQWPFTHVLDTLRLAQNHDVLKMLAKKTQSFIYNALFGRAQALSHNAIGDVVGLCHILSHPFVCAQRTSVTLLIQYTQRLTYPSKDSFQKCSIESIHTQDTRKIAVIPQCSPAQSSRLHMDTSLGVVSALRPAMIALPKKTLYCTQCHTHISAFFLDTHSCQKTTMSFTHTSHIP